eukprot:scaffold7307_cov125-Isochrysis_galbana.AAC.6
MLATRGAEHTPCPRLQAQRGNQPDVTRGHWARKAVCGVLTMAALCAMNQIRSFTAAGKEFG